MNYKLRPAAGVFALTLLSAFLYFFMPLCPINPPYASAADEVIKGAAGAPQKNDDTEQNKKTKSKKETQKEAMSEAEIKLSKLPRCALASTTGPSRVNEFPPAGEIKWLLENPKKAFLEKYGDKCKMNSTNFYDYYIVEKPGLVIYYDYESDHADWVKCEWVKELSELRPGAGFAAIARALGPAAIVERHGYRGYEVIYDAGGVFLRFSSFEKDGKNSDLTIYSREGILKYLGHGGTAKENAKVPKFKKESVPPRKDEAFKDPKLESALLKLKRSAEEKNYEVLLSFVADDIKWSFGGDDGKPGFIKEWKLDSDPQNSEIWFELDEMSRSYIYRFNRHLKNIHSISLDNSSQFG